ncbi:hypothetical protein EON65_26310 [archaeon]|nr:MAG: hypothetical protein EON65_26310 [archaeon]
MDVMPPRGVCRDNRYILMAHKYESVSIHVIIMHLLYVTFLPHPRVPGNFHIEMRSKHHNINPTAANLSHVVHSLTFGPVMPASATRRLEKVPNEFFDLQSTQSMNEHVSYG